MKDDPRYYQITASIQAGNSGGPLLNMNGEVVGIVTSTISAIRMLIQTGNIPQNINYAVKVQCLLNLLKEVPQKPTNIKELGREAGNLESLVARLQDSVVIVEAD